MLTSALLIGRLSVEMSGKNNLAKAQRRKERSYPLRLCEIISSNQMLKMARLLSLSDQLST